MTTDTPRTDACPERLTKRPFGCKCETLREKVLGDGCEECNKALVIEMLTDERDELQAEVARLQMELDATCNAEELRQEREARKRAEAERDAYKKLALELCAELCQICKDPIHRTQLEELSK